MVVRLDEETGAGMTNAREAARRSVLQLVEELATGRADAAQSRCDPDARWWLPLDGADELPAAQACARLAHRLTSAGSVEVEALVVAPDGKHAVVELRATVDGGSETTTVTSVLRMNGALVTAGRTYVDVAAWGGVRA
jgi:ketosteroid isomerase-like protein